MTNQPVYFDWNFWVSKVGPQGAEYLKNLYDRVGGSQSSAVNLVDINTTVTGISDAVDSIGESAPASLMVEVDRLRRKVSELESLLAR